MTICRPPTSDCKNPDTYGMICVCCGDCGRFIQICCNCGKWGSRNPDTYNEWGFVEFINVFSAPICPECRPLFKEEDETNWPDDIEKWGFSLNNKKLPYFGQFTKRH